jgi:hypothetical protein
MQWLGVDATGQRSASKKRAVSPAKLDDPQ